MPHPSEPIPIDAALPALVAAWVPAGAVYLDAYAGVEWAYGAPAAGEAGSAAAAAACAALRAGAAVVLVEEDPVLLERLRADLEGRGERVRIGAGPLPDPGEILLVEADFAAVADHLLALPPDTPVRLRAAPPAARRLPWRILQGLLADPALELLLGFPCADFLSQGRRSGPLADLPPFARRLVEGCSGLLGDPRHAWLAAWRAAPDEDAALRGLLHAFTARLQAAAAERLVKSVAPAPGRALFLITASAEAAIALNESGSPDAAPVPELLPVDLFGAPLDDTPTPVDPAPALAERIAASWRGHSLPLVEVLAALALTSARLDDVRRALAILRRSGRAEYRTLRRTDAQITFPRDPRVPPPRPGTRRAPAPHADLFSG